MDEAPSDSSKEDQARELRSKLIKRLAMAGVLVAMLLGVLAFFDYLSSPSDEPDEPVYSRPVPVPAKKAVSQPVTPSTNLPEPPATAAVVAEPPPPEVASPPAIPAAGKPDARTAGTATVSPERVPAALPKPPPEAATPVAARAVRPVPEASAPPAVAVPDEALASTPAKPTARVVEAHPAPVAAPSGVSRLFSGFLLQAGVFTNQERAEELHAKLTLSGIPSTLETRVQVGPFRTRQEAEAARARLRELGVETVLVPPKSGKH